MQASTLSTGLNDQECSILEKNLTVVQQTSFEVIATAIPLIFIRCGAECGKIKRLLDEHEISWGYFTDHNPFEPHCNAHPNNLVVLDPLTNHHRNLLGVLDLDLAYGSDTFVNTIEPDPEFFTDADNLSIQQGKYGTRDLVQFDDWLNSEKYELELALGGNENMANFSYAMRRQDSEPGSAGIAGVDAKAVGLLMSSLLRDFCVKSYREHYDRQSWLWAEERGAERLEQLYLTALPAISALVRIAILLTKMESI